MDDAEVPLMKEYNKTYPDYAILHWYERGQPQQGAFLLMAFHISLANRTSWMAALNCLLLYKRATQPTVFGIFVEVIVHS